MQEEDPLAALNCNHGYSLTVTEASRRLVARTFWAEGISRLGDAISVVALPLTAVLVLHASAGELALIGAAQALPILLLSLPAGAWVDRRRARWPLLIASDLVRAGLLSIIPLAALGHWLSLPLLAVVALLLSAAGTTFDLAYAGWLPRLLAGDELHRANARVELARSAAAVGGPSAGGALVALLSAPVALLADALSFVASAVLVASVRRAEPIAEPIAAPAIPRSPGVDLSAGLRFIMRQPLVRAVTATAAINNLARSVAMGIAVLYLVDEGRLSAAEVGLAFAIGNTGFVGGALASRRISARLGMGATMQLGVGLFGPAMLAFALAPASLAGLAFTAMLFANGFGIAIHNVNQVTVRQLLTPDHLRARVAAVFRIVIFGAIPAGTALGGLIGETLGLRAALVVSGVALLAGSGPYLLTRMTRLRSIDQLAPGAITP